MNNISRFFGIRFKWAAVLTAIFCLAVAGPASAAGRSRPCADDADRLCKDVPKGGGRIANCLREHKDELSPACKENIEKARKQVKEAKKACHDDVQKFCKDTEPGKGRIAQCLRMHEAELSQGCKDHLSRTRGRK